MLLARVKVRSVSRPSPSFVRVELAGPDLAEFGVDGPFYDQRIKLLFPGPAGLPPLRSDHWWEDYAALPEGARGTMRTYTVAGVEGDGADAGLLVDIVLHPGAHGPGSTWAAHVATGDEVLTVVPRRGVPAGGIEFAPGDARRLLLAGDETALPAIARIAAELPRDAVGTAFVEVPAAGDIRDLGAPAGLELRWLVRHDRPVGAPLVEAVGAYLGFAPEPAADDEVDPDVWETPTYSSSGESLAPPQAAEDRYAWIAGEAGMVTTLRRHLVDQLGMPRHRVAFMGYWRQGVSMRG